MKISTGGMDNPHGVIYPLRGETSSGDGAKVAGTTVFEPGEYHQGWVKCWVSPPIATVPNDTISGSFKFVAAYQEGKDEMNMFPVLRLWVMKKKTTHIDSKLGNLKLPDRIEYIYESNVRGNLFDGTSSEEASVWSRTASWPEDKVYFSETVSPVSIEKEDRIVAETMWADLNTLYGTAAHRFAYNSPTDGGMTRLEFEQVMTFYETVENTLDAVYSVKNYVSKTMTSSYNLIYKKIINKKDFLYHLQGMPTFLENYTPYRGRNCLRMEPDVLDVPPTIGLVYEDRWVTNRASLNRYVMLDDFEKYKTDNELNSAWTSEYLSDRIIHTRTFSEVKDLSQYDIISFFAKARANTKIKFYFEDDNGYKSGYHTYHLSTYWERHEREIYWGACISTIVRKIHIETFYSGDVYVDDIVTLCSKEEKENDYWIPINLMGLELTRQMKYNELKIALKDGETMQLAGETNAVGMFTAKDLLSKNKAFLKKHRTNSIPLYFRYRNQGLPIVVNNYERGYSIFDRNRSVTDDTVEFVEIYDAEL